MSSERIWLLHRGGFTPATKCGSADPDTGKLRIRLTTSGEELLVDEEDVEKVLFFKLNLFKFIIFLNVILDMIEKFCCFLKNYIEILFIFFVNFQFYNRNLIVN